MNEEERTALDNLLSEFFSSQDNARRNEIERVLQRYKEHGECVAISQDLLLNARTAYLQWFGASMMEHFINQHWRELSPDGATQLFTFLLNLLRERQGSLSPFVNNAVAKVIVHMGKRTWPQRLPHYLSQVVELIKVDDSASVGVYLLVLSMEEFTSTREDVESQRKSQLKELVIQSLPDVLEVFRVVLTCPGSGGDDSDALKRCEWCMSALLHLFTWIPLNERAVSGVVEALLSFLPRGGDHAVMSFSCLNELLRRNYVPAEHIGFLLQLFGQVLSWLSAFVREPRESAIALMGVRDKFTEFTHLFVQRHMMRVEADGRFPMAEFFSLLLDFTFGDGEAEEFIACLEVWEVLIDQVEQRPEAAERYRPVLVSLARALATRLYHNGGGGGVGGGRIASLCSTHPRVLDVATTILAALVHMYPMETIEFIIRSCHESIGRVSSSLHGGGTADHQLIHDALTALKLSTCVVNYTSSNAQVYDVLLGFLSSIVDVGRVAGPRGVSMLVVGVLDALWCWCVVLRPDRGGSTSVGASLGAQVAMMAVQHIPSAIQDVSMSGAKLLVALGSLAKLPVLLGDGGGVGVDHLCAVAMGAPQHAQPLVYAAVSNALVLVDAPHPGDHDAWSARAHAHAALVEPMGRAMQVVAEHSPSMEHGDTLMHVMRVMEHVAKHIHHHGTPMALRVVHHSIGGCAELSLDLLPRYATHAQATCCILAFQKALVEALGPHLGHGYIPRLVEAVGKAFAASDPTRVMGSESSVLDHFVDVLVLVTEGGPLSGDVLDGILHVALDTLIPCASACGPHVYNLLHSLATRQWRRLQSMPERLDGILGALVGTLGSTDVAVVRQGLLALESINDKHRLYTTDSFAAHHRTRVIHALLAMVVAKGHDLLRDDLISALYDLGATQWTHFYQCALPDFLQAQSSLSPHQMKRLYAVMCPQEGEGPKDLPSFRRCLNAFTNDFGCV